MNRLSVLIGFFHLHITRILFPFLFLVTLNGCSKDPQDEAADTTVAEQTEVAEEVKALDFLSGWPETEDETAKAFVANCQDTLAKAEAQFRQIESSTQNDPLALLNHTNQLDIFIDAASGKSSLFSHVHPNETVRNVAEVCEQKLTQLISEISLSVPFYEHLQQADLSKVPPLAKRYAEDWIEGFKRSGVDKDEATRKRIRELNDELTLISQEFGKNIREDVRAIEVTEAELDGLPEDFISARKKEGEETIRLTTDYPDYIPVMQYAHNDDLRKRFYTIFRSRGYPANKSVLKDLLTKRYEYAQLIGFPHYADYITDNLMIESAENASNFIEKINRIAKPRSDKDYQELLTRLQKIDPKAKEVGDWQKTYLENLLKNEVYKVDSQAVRQYFSYDNVKAGIFGLVTSLFDVEIREWDAEVWHPAVKAYEIVDGGEVIGRFYLDMHPRPGKYKHAAHFGIQAGVKGVQLPMSALVCNFPGGGDGEALMEHSDVETFLHEFGHLLHSMFGGHQPWLGLTGIRTERDFVEAPSQMLEEWVWDYDTLKTFAKNKKGETIPKSMVESMNKGRAFGQGIFTRHQMFYASISLNYYNRPPAQVDLDEMMIDLQGKYSPFDYVDDTYFYTSFGHLDGYSAIYYTYMWSKVIAADMFSEFKKHGMRNKTIAKRYRDTVLAPGGSKDAAELVKDFLGRPYGFESFGEDLQVD